MSRIITINCIVSILWPLIFLNFSNGQNEILECMIRDGDNELHLKLQKTQQLLANENLPVWTANSQRTRGCQHDGSVEHKRKLNFVEKNIGSFILYHDKEQSAAITYFMKSKTLIGIVDTRFIILNLPLNECNLGHHVGGQYIKKLQLDGATNLDAHLKPLDLSMRREDESVDNDGEPSTSTEDKQHTTLYPEIMLFIPHTITKIAKAAHKNTYLTVLVTHYIVYFHAVDMLMSKLSTNNIKINLNLAGIVIEEQENAFSFVKPFNWNFLQGYYQNVHYVDALKTLKSFPHYIAQNYNIFPPDSFDFFFIATSNSLWSTILNGVTAGLSVSADVYGRRLGKMSDGYLSGTIVQNVYGYEYITASHEIAHLMTIGHDPLSKGFRNGNAQCYAIMQTVGTFCPDCLKWSDESIEDLKKYVKYNRNRCYLLNSPRSLHPYGSRMKTLSPLDQCRCYGFEPQTSTHLDGYLDMIPVDFCHKNIFCGTGPDKAHLPLPVDGTPCSNDGVCWNQICQTILNAKSYRVMNPDNLG